MIYYVKIGFKNQKGVFMLEKNLKKMIAESGKTQTEIEKELNLSRGYINKILTGKNTPSQEKLREIVKNCNGDINLFMLEWWLKDIPYEINDRLNNLFKILFILTEAFLDLYPNNISNYDEFKKMFSEEEKANLLLSLCNVKINFDDIPMINTKELIKIEDDYMEPVIPKNSYIAIRFENEYHSGDIICFKYKDKTECRCLQVINNNNNLLYSYKGNKNYLLKRDDYVILGKVIKVSYEL